MTEKKAPKKKETAQKRTKTAQNGIKTAKTEKKLPKKLLYWTRYDRIAIIKSWARNGLTDAEIAKNMGISRSTLYEYRKKSTILDEALQESKEIADMVVENALYKKAISGDVAAMIYWLKNRKADKWRDKPQDVDTGKGGGVVEMPAIKNE